MLILVVLYSSSTFVKVSVSITEYVSTYFSSCPFQLLEYHPQWYWWGIILSLILNETGNIPTTKNLESFSYMHPVKLEVYIIETEIGPEVWQPVLKMTYFVHVWLALFHLSFGQKFTELTYPLSGSFVNKHLRGF